MGCTREPMDLSLWWEVLGCSRDASEDTIEQAYRTGGADRETPDRVWQAYQQALAQWRERLGTCAECGQHVNDCQHPRA